MTATATRPSPADVLRARLSAPHTYAELVSRGKWRAYRHLRYAGERITRAIERGGGRIAIHMPPRHGKSQLSSVYLPLWFLNTWPEKRVMVCSYAAELAQGFGRRVRNEMEQNPLCVAELSEDSQAAGRWNTPQGGGMLCTGVGGGATGFGYDLGILDDPLKNWQDAFSPTLRRRQIEWYESVFYTRAEPGATMILPMTRWHPEDLGGYVASKTGDEAWEVINLPAMALPGDPLGREPGEALCPERYPADRLRSMKATMPEQVWDAMFQQNPRGATAGAVYSNFTDQNIRADLTIRPGLPLHVSLDFNINPGMHLEVGQHDETNDLLTCVHEVHGPRMTVRGAMEAFASLLSRIGPATVPEIQVFGDATGAHASSPLTTDSGYSIVRGAIDRLGKPMRLRVPAANPPVIDRVMTFQDAIRDSGGAVHYLVHPSCRCLIRDLREQETDVDGVPDKSRQEIGHAGDAEGYRVHYLRPIGGPIRMPTGRFIA